MASILCKYFVQNDPNEEASGYPNLFVLSQRFSAESPVRLRDVMADFPLLVDPRLHYHLRFETSLPGAPTSPIWVDILNEEATVPLVAPGVISIKVLKLPGEIRAKLKRPKRPVPRQYVEEEVSPTAEDPMSAPPPPAENKKEFKLPPQTEERKEIPNRVRLDSDSARAVFDFDFGGGSESHSEEKKTVAAPTETVNNSKASVVSEDEAEKRPDNGPVPPKRAPLPLKPLAVRVKELTDQVHKQWEKEEDDTKEREKAYSMYEEKIRNWVGQSGTKNNIRTLLCTMQHVLWSDCMWKPVSMGDVISTGSVKRYYVMAITMFHPDKIQGLQDQGKRYIADRVFNALNDAYNEFRKENK